MPSDPFPPGDSDLEALYVELQRSWERGERTPAEAFLARYAGRELNRHGAAALAYHELIVREGLGEAPRLEEYLHRFPDLADELQLLFEAERYTWTGLGPGEAGEPLGDYELLEELGRGGMGVVYRARHVPTDRIVALKMLLAGPLASPEEVARFRREAEAVTALRHPNIVSVLEVGEFEGRHFFTMEYVAGLSLAALVEKGPLPPEQAARYVRAMAEAMAYAHAQGIFHRDVKPANVLVDADDQPRLTDFGLALRWEDDFRLTVTGQQVGTPSYMAPELARGLREAVGPASDVYSLGANLYELLTGRPPFRAATPFATLLQVMESEPARPCAVNPSVPVPLETICLKCLSKVPRERYGNAQDLADDLGRYLKGEPIRARPPGWWARGRKWVRRHPVRSAVAAMVVMVLLPLATWAIRSQVKESEARTQVLLEAQGRQSAEDLAAVNEYHRLVSGVAEQIAHPQLGWTYRCLKEIQEAAAMPVDSRDLLRLRALAAKCLAGVDLRPVAVLAKGIDANCLAFSPDGKRLAIAENYGKSRCVVQVYDAANSKLLQEYPVTSLPPGNVIRIRSVAFSGDGKRLAVGTHCGLVHSWNTETPIISSAVWNAHSDPVHSLAFQPGSAMLVTCSADRTVKFWDAEKGTSLARFDSDGGVSCLAFHPKGTLLASARDDWFEIHEVKKSSTGTLSLLRWYNDRHETKVHLAAFSPDGRVCIFDKGGNRLMCQNVPDQMAKGTQRFGPPDEDCHSGNIRHLEFHPGGSILVTGSSVDRQVRFWDRATSKSIASLSVEGSGQVFPVFSPDGRHFAVQGRDETVIYEIGGLQVQTQLAHHGMPVRDYAISADGQTLACCAVNFSPHNRNSYQFATLSRWKVLDGNLIDTMRNYPVYAASSHVRPNLVYHPEGQWLTWSDPLVQHQLSLNLRDGQKREVNPFPFSIPPRFSPDGKLVWGAIAKYRLGWQSLDTPVADEVVSLRWPELTPVTRWPNLESEKRTRISEITCLEVRRRWVVAGSADCSTKLFSTDNGDHLAHQWPSPNNAPVYSVALSHDETLAASGTQTGTIQIARIPSGTIAAELPAHRDRVESLAFSPDDRLLASGSKDGTIRIYERSGDSFEERITLPATGPVAKVCFHPDGNRLAVLVQNEYGVRLWHLDRLRKRLEEMGLGW